MATTTHQENTVTITTDITLESITGLEIVKCNGYYAIVNRALGNVEYVKTLKIAEAVLISVAKDRLAEM
jgi:hypothetical protein